MNPRERSWQSYQWALQSLFPVTCHPDKPIPEVNLTLNGGLEAAPFTQAVCVLTARGEGLGLCFTTLHQRPGTFYSSHNLWASISASGTGEWSH